MPGPRPGFPPGIEALGKAGSIALFIEVVSFFGGKRGEGWMICGGRGMERGKVNKVRRDETNLVGNPASSIGQF